MLRRGRPKKWQTAPEDSDVVAVLVRTAFIVVYVIVASAAGYGFALTPAWVGVTMAAVYSLVVAFIWWRQRDIPWQRPFSLLVDIIMVSGVAATHGMAAAGVKDVFYLIIFAAGMWYHSVGAVAAASVSLVAYSCALCHASGLSMTMENALSIAFATGAIVMPLVGFVVGVLFRVYAGELLRLAEIEHEIGLARRLQENLLPDRLPEIPGWSLCAVMRPAREVGGDMYSFHRLSDGCVMFAVADMAGKSVYGLVHLSLIHSHLRAAASASADLTAIVNELSRRAYPELQPDSYAAAVFVKFRPNQGEIEYVNCGHPPPLIVTPGSGKPQPLATGEPIIGATLEHNYSSATAIVPPGGLLVCYTDGLIEARSPEGEMFGEERLHRFVVRHAHLEPGALCHALLDEVARFTAGAMEDDMTVAVFKRSAN